MVRPGLAGLVGLVDGLLVVVIVGLGLVVIGVAVGVADVVTDGTGLVAVTGANDGADVDCVAKSSYDNQ